MLWWVHLELENKRLRRYVFCLFVRKVYLCFVFVFFKYFLGEGVSLGWYWVGLKRIQKFNKILNMVQILIFFYFILLSACLSGFSGMNCTKKCPFPTYGHRCQKLCKCNKEQCDVSTGCTLLLDGIFIFFISLLNVKWVFPDSNINPLNTRIVPKKIPKVYNIKLV